MTTTATTSAEAPARLRTEFERLAQEFEGLTATECCDACNGQHCAIGGSLHFKNSDGTTTLDGKCSHPRKGGLVPIAKMNSVIHARFRRAEKYLRLVEAMKEKQE